MKPETRIGSLPDFSLAFACMALMPTLPHRSILCHARFVWSELHNLFTGMVQVLFLVCLYFFWAARALRWGLWVPVATTRALASAIRLMNQCLPVAKGKVVILEHHD